MNILAYEDGVLSGDMSNPIVARKCVSKVLSSSSSNCRKHAYMVSTCEERFTR